MTAKEQKSCIQTIELFRRLAYNVHGLVDVLDAENCDKILKMLEQTSADSSQDWIPCSERLPKKESNEQRRGTYLTTNGYGVVCMMNYEFEGDFGFVGWGTNKPYDIQIVAWMPLPEPWKGEQDG